MVPLAIHSSAPADGAVYPEYVPTVIPLVVFVRQSLRYVLRIAFHALRGWAAAFHWLVMLPCCNMLTLRSLTWLADSL
jgi:hypothetical protein